MRGDVYRQRGTNLLIFALVLTLLWMIYLIYTEFFMEHGLFHIHHRGRIIRNALGLPLLLFFLPFFVRTKYTLSPNSLLIKGALRYKEEIYYSSIKHVEAEYDTEQSSFSAKKIKNIRISYGVDRTVTIHPARTEEFLSKLMSRVPKPRI